MALNPSYLITTKNLESFLNSLITAKAPDAFTQKFLESLEFKSTNDRLFISLLKGLGFVDPNGVPTERYYKFLDQSQSKVVLAEAIKESYSDLFAVYLKANELSGPDVKNKLRTLTLGKNSDKVLGLMANTFRALVAYADWDVPPKPADPGKPADTLRESSKTPADFQSDEPEDAKPRSKLLDPQFHYNIQIHLPESRDPAVYDVLFKSLKRHLL